MGGGRRVNTYAHVGLTLCGSVITLREAIGAGNREIVAFVGAGGKTTAMFQLAHELLAEGARPVVTTTTKILVPAEDPERSVLVDTGRSSMVAVVTRILAEGRVPVAAVATTAEGKLVGVPPEWIDDLAGRTGATHVLVEADGAARKPFKAPGDGEPVIPAATTIVVAVVGADALGHPVSEVAHRPERVTALTGLAPDAMLDAHSIARVMLDARGVMKGAPATARKVVIVNKADDAARVRDARAIARELIGQGAERVVIAALERSGVLEVSGRA